jgi:hypothetical protein
MTRRVWLPGTFILALPLLLNAQDLPPAQAGGVADISVQGYYLGGNSQPLTAISGTGISFREYLPGLGFVTGNLEGYADSTHGRAGDNFVTLHGLRWKGRRWTLTGGDFKFRTALVPAPFTNYSYPEIAARGVKVEMTDGMRHFTFFGGEETLQTGPRITFRTQAPQSILGAAVEQGFGERLRIGVRYLGLSSPESRIAENPFFFPEGSEFRRTDSLSLQSAFVAGRGLTLFSDTTLSREQFASIALYTRTAPFSSIIGARWQREKLTFTLNYGSLSRSALPALGYYFGDRKGPFAEVRYKVFGSFELFGSAVRSENNIERNAAILNFSTEDVTGGASAILPWKIGLSGQYSTIGLRGELLSDPAQNQSQRNSQSQVSLSRTISNHSLTFTGRDLDLVNRSYRQKQKSAEIQDNVHFSRFGLGGAVRMQQQSSNGQLQNSLFVRGSGQMRLRRVSVYGQFEVGNDLINKTLFATNSVNTTVAGVEIPMVRGWTMRIEAFRTTLLTALNPANILVLQTQGSGVADILNDFNQWSFFVRLSHRTHWGAPLPETVESSNQVVYGTIEGFVYDDAAGAHGSAGVSVKLDKSRTASTDASGRYRFVDVPEGAHAVTLNVDDLAAEFSPGPAPPASTGVKPRSATRVDLRVVKAGSSIRGVVRGLAVEDQGVARLENIVANLFPVRDGAEAIYTTCDSAGEFAFYNLTPGLYRVSIDAATLPENYVLVLAGEVEVDLAAAAEVPAVGFRIEKRVPQLPVRQVFDASVR